MQMSGNHSKRRVECAASSEIKLPPKLPRDRFTALPECLSAFVLRFLSVKDHLRVCCTAKALNSAGKLCSSNQVRSNRLQQQTRQRLFVGEVLRSSARPRVLALPRYPHFKRLAAFLRSVEELEIGTEALIGACAKPQTSLANLQHLCVNDPNVDCSPLFLVLSKCARLRAVHIDNFHADLLEQLPKNFPLAGVRWRSFVWQSAQPEGIKALARFPVTHLTGLHLQDEATSHLAQCRTLTHLDCQDYGLSDKGLVNLSKLPLAFLSIRRSSVLRAGSGLVSLASRPLRRLHLANVTLSSEHAPNVLANLRVLESLRFSEFQAALAANLCSLLSPGLLQELCIDSPVAVSDMLKPLLQMTSLQILSLRCHARPTDIAALSKAMRQLRKFYFCTEKSDLAAVVILCAAARAFPSMEQIDCDTSAPEPVPSIEETPLPRSVINRARIANRARAKPFTFKLRYQAYDALAVDTTEFTAYHMIGDDDAYPEEQEHHEPSDAPIILTWLLFSASE